MLDPPQWERIRTLRGCYPVVKMRDKDAPSYTSHKRIAYNPQGTMIAGYSGGWALVVDANTLEKKGMRPHPADLIGVHTICMFEGDVDWAPCGTMFASFGKDMHDQQFVSVWHFDEENRLEDGAMFNCGTKAQAALTAVTFVAQGEKLACANGRGWLDVYDVRTERPMIRFRPHQRSIESMACRPRHPQVVATGSFDSTVGLWDLRSRRKTQIWMFLDSDVCDWVTFDAEGDTLASVSHNAVQGTRTVRLWDVRFLGDPARCSSERVPYSFHHCGFSCDGNMLITASRADLVVWDVHLGQSPTKMKRIEAPWRVDDNTQIKHFESVAIHPSRPGHTAVVVDDGQLYVVDIRDRHPLRTQEQVVAWLSE